MLDGILGDFVATVDFVGAGAVAGVGLAVPTGGHCLPPELETRLPLAVGV